MENGEQSAFPNDHQKNSENIYNLGLTKREYACIKLGIPESGDAMLDNLIIKSERKKIATVFMASFVSHRLFTGREDDYDDKKINKSVCLADALIERLNILKIRNRYHLNTVAHQVAYRKNR